MLLGTIHPLIPCSNAKNYTLRWEDGAVSKMYSFIKMLGHFSLELVRELKLWKDSWDFLSIYLEKSRFKYVSYQYEIKTLNIFAWFWLIWTKKYGVALIIMVSSIFEFFELCWMYEKRYWNKISNLLTWIFELCENKYWKLLFTI